MNIVLRDYQQDVIARARARIAKGARRVIIQAPTGAGKTTIASEIVRRAVDKGTRVLFLAHRRKLIDQVSDRFKQFSIPHGIVMAGIRPTGSIVQVASRDTLLSRCVNNKWVTFPPAELVIVDECHNIKLDGSNDEMSGYKAILDVYPNAVILGLSATPSRQNGKGLGSFFQAIECTVPSSRLIDDGYLTPVIAYAPQRLGSARRRGEKVKALAGDPVSWWKKLASGRPTVAFASKVAESLALASAFNANGIPAAHMDAHTEDEERDRLIGELKAGRLMVLSNVGLITEGADIPELSCCILLRPCESYTLYAQICGRIMRAHPSKTDALLIDHAGAVYVHGSPNNDVEWTLDEDDTVDRRNRKSNVTPPGKKPIVCPNCSAVFSGAIKCPMCGYVLPKKMRPANVRDELLTKVSDEVEAISAEERRLRIWNRCLAQAANMRKTYMLARVFYMKNTGNWPERSLPHNDFDRNEWDMPVADLLPQFVRRKAQ